jgi:tetratricopeptide (TPR) repeat protein
LKLLIICIVIIPVICFADSLNVKIESLYNQGQYQEAIGKINEILNSSANIPDSTLIKLYSYQAFSYVAIDNKDAALTAFRYLLILNPKLELDPRFVSPKIIGVFEESKRLRGDSNQLVPSPFINVSKLKSSAAKSHALRSLLYPGLGQLHQNKKTKGYLFLGFETASIIGLVTSHLLTNSTHNKYLDARLPNDIEEKYDNYKFWYQTRIGFTATTIGIWIYNYVDVTIFE